MLSGRIIFIFIPVGKFLFRVSKISLEQRSIERCSNDILLTLNRYLSAGSSRQTNYVQSQQIL